MQEGEINLILKSSLVGVSNSFDTPSESDWLNLETRLGYRFPNSYRIFIEKLTNYVFPGDMLNIATGVTNGNDSVMDVYTFEIENGDWDVRLIPFYDIGNGDYFCFKANGRGDSVYYYDHSSGEVSIESESFDDWLRGLPEFLS